MAALIVSTSGSAIAAAKRNKQLRDQSELAVVRSTKTPSLKRLGVFVSAVICWCLGAHNTAATANCPASEPLTWVQLEAVVDGDTLLLSDGRKVRVIGANTPELGYGGKAGQPLGSEAKTAVTTFFQRGAPVGLQIGQDSADRYGRLLTHVFRSDGISLAEYLIASGLAWHLAIPPNDRYWQCLRQLEAVARKQSLGVWSHSEYVPKPVRPLSSADSGFQRMQGVVQSVNRSNTGWWLHMGDLAIRLQDRDLVYFDEVDPHRWLHQTLTIRGWVIDRSHSGGVKNKGYPPFMINLRHPAMLESIVRE